MRNKAFTLITTFFLFCLSSVPSFADVVVNDTQSSQVLLTKAVEKLIIDVQNLKLRVLELEKRIESLKEKKSSALLSDSSYFLVLRGKVVPSKTSCLLATVKLVTEKGKKWVLSLVPQEAPIYVKRWKGWYVYLTLPQYCSNIRERVKDAVISHISIPNVDNSTSLR